MRRGSQNDEVKESFEDLNRGVADEEENSGDELSHIL